MVKVIISNWCKVAVMSISGAFLARLAVSADNHLLSLLSLAGALLMVAGIIALAMGDLND